MRGAIGFLVFTSLMLGTAAAQHHQNGNHHSGNHQHSNHGSRVNGYATISPGTAHYGNRYYGSGYPGGAYGGTAYYSNTAIYAPGSLNIGTYGPTTGYVWGPYGAVPAYGPYAYGGFGVSPNAAISPFASKVVIVQQQPVWNGPNPFDNSALADAQKQNDLRWGRPIEAVPVVNDPQPPLPPTSSPAAQQKSLQEQVEGDAQMQKQRWATAYLHYGAAIKVAPDRADSVLRMAFCLTAMNRLESAIGYFKRAFQIDPNLIRSGATLESIYGDGSALSIANTMRRVTEWVAEDIRSPDRIFLLGVMLHFQGDQRSRELMETGYRLAGRGPHFLVFLQENPGQLPANAGAVGNIPPAPLPAPLPAIGLPGAGNDPGPGLGNPLPLQNNPTPLPPAPGAAATAPAANVPGLNLTIPAPLPERPGI